jgi:hypothetical protein
MTDQEMKDRFAALIAHSEETDRKIEKLCGKVEEIDRWMKEEIDRRARGSVKESGGIDRVWDRLNRNIDRVCGKFVDIDYDRRKIFFQDEFEERLEFGGVKYDEMIAGFGRKDETVNFKADIALFNDVSVALVMVVYDPGPDFIVEFATEKAGKFRVAFPKYNNYKVYLGIAEFSFNDETVKKAREYGIGIVKPAGTEAWDGIEIEAEHLKVY